MAADPDSETKRRIKSEKIKKAMAEIKERKRRKKEQLRIALDEMHEKRRRMKEEKMVGDMIIYRLRQAIVCFLLMVCGTER